MKKSFVIALFLISLIAYFPAKAQDKVIDEVIAVVGSHPILYSDVEAQYMQMRAQMQVPDPLQICPVTALATHTKPPHGDPAASILQAPVPLQVPSSLHSAPTAQSLSSSWPESTGPHSPLMPWCFLAALHA